MEWVQKSSSRGLLNRTYRLWWKNFPKLSRWGVSRWLSVGFRRYRQIFWCLFGGFQNGWISVDFSGTDEILGCLFGGFQDRRISADLQHYRQRSLVFAGGFQEGRISAYLWRYRLILWCLFGGFQDCWISVDFSDMDKILWVLYPYGFFTIIKCPIINSLGLPLFHVGLCRRSYLSPEENTLLQWCTRLLPI